MLTHAIAVFVKFAKSVVDLKRTKEQRNEQQRTNFAIASDIRL